MSFSAIIKPSQKCKSELLRYTCGALMILIARSIDSHCEMGQKRSMQTQEEEAYSVGMKIAQKPTRSRDSRLNKERFTWSTNQKLQRYSVNWSNKKRKIHQMKGVSSNPNSPFSINQSKESQIVPFDAAVAIATE